MLGYLQALQGAVLVFPLVGLLLFVPLYRAHLKRFGEVHEYRAAISYLFIFSVLAALFLTALPLPKDTQLTCNWSEQIGSNQFVPFNSFVDISRFEARHGLGWGLKGLAANKALWQILLNTLMLMPFGFLMRKLYNTGFFKCLIYAFGFSLFLETSQLTGLWGLAHCPYRVFDVDDLFTNTLGALLGWGLYGAFRWLPDPKHSEDDLWYRKSTGRDDDDPGYKP